MNAARVMLQGLEKGVYFQCMEGDILKAVSTRGIEVDYGNLRPFKTGITWLLEHGFACVRDSLTYAEMKALSSAYGLEVVKDPLTCVQAYRRAKQASDKRYKNAITGREVVTS